MNDPRVADGVPDIALPTSRREAGEVLPIPTLPAKEEAVVEVEVKYATVGDVLDVRVEPLECSQP